LPPEASLRLFPIFESHPFADVAADCAVNGFGDEE
jgi:hypothetical protein